MGLVDQDRGHYISQVSSTKYQTSIDVLANGSNESPSYSIAIDFVQGCHAIGLGVCHLG